MTTRDDNRDGYGSGPEAFLTTGQGYVTEHSYGDAFDGDGDGNGRFDVRVPPMPEPPLGLYGDVE